MAERHYMEVNMPEYSVWIYVILLTLLDAAVRSQVSLHDSDNSYLQSNNDVQYIVDNIPVPVHNERSSASTLRVKNSQDVEVEDGLVFNTNLKLIPPVLDFKERCLGIAHHEKVLLLNESANKTIHMSSISGETTHFHSSFFQDKMVPPRGNTSFSVVFLGRGEGLAQGHLRIHTSEGIFKYQVQGVGVANSYRLRPLVGIKLPVNSTLDHPIKLYNPNPYPIQLEEVYSSSSDIHLELPTGQQDGPRQLWELPPFRTKTVTNIHFKAKSSQNHSAYVRLKLNHTTEVIVIPLEISVSNSPGLYLKQDGLDFGMSGSNTPPTTLPLIVNNSARKPIFIESIESSPPTKALELNFKPVKVSPDNSNPVEVATVTLNWQEALKEGVTSGTLVLKGRSGQEKLLVKWRAKPLEGGLWFQGDDPLSFVVRNDYRVAVAIIGYELQGYPDGDTSKGLQNLHSKKLHLDPKVLAPGVYTSLSLQQVLPPHSQFLIIHTNISTLNQTLSSPDAAGKLTPVILSHRYEDVLDLGLVSRGEKKYAYLALLNLNRESVDIRHWRYSHSAAEFQLLGIDSGKLSIPQLLARTTYGDYNRNNLRVVKPGHYAVFRLYVEAPKQDGLVEGEVCISTEHEDIEIAFRLEVAPGTLEVTPESLVLDNCFPGMRCETPFHVKSTFASDMAVTAVVAVPPNPCLLFTPSDPQATVTPHTTTQVGHLGWDASKAPSYTRYLGLQNFSYTEWTKLLSLPQKTFSFDIQLVNKQWKQFQNLTKNGDNPWNNISLQVDTTKVRNLVVNARARLSWPRLAQAKGGVVMFPLTQVGNETILDLKFVNNAAQPVLLQLVLEQDYPAGGVLTSNIPRRLLPSCNPCTSVNRRSFSMDTTAEETDLDFGDVKPHPSTVVLLLKPSQSAVATFKFHPSVPDPSSALLFIRNNLTMLEVVRFTGTGMAPQFRFGKRKPGSKTPLLFEYVVSQLADCERISSKTSDSGISGLTIKRSFTARNSGDLPIFISNFRINGIPCEGFGFCVLDCHPFQLEPNASRLIDIAFTPDFTLSRIERTLTIETSMGFAVNYSLVSTLPAYLLASCSAALARPSWEPLLYYSVVSMMVFLLFCVVTVAFFESDRVLNSALMAMTRDKNVQPTFNLKAIDSGVMSNGNCNESQQYSSNSMKWDQVPNRTNLQDNSNSNSTCKGKKKRSAEDNDRIRNRQKEKENASASRKPRWAASSPSLNSPEGDMERSARTKNCPIHDGSLCKQTGRRDKKQKKKGSKIYCSCPSFEDETSSTTTESSNNDEDKEHVPSLNADERKLSKESVKKLNVSCRNNFEEDDEVQKKNGNKAKQAESRQTPSPLEEEEKKEKNSPPKSSITANKTARIDVEKLEKKLNGDILLPPSSLELPYKLKPLKNCHNNPLGSYGAGTISMKRKNSLPKSQLSVDRSQSNNKCSSMLGWSKLDKPPVSYSTIARCGIGANDLPSQSRFKNFGSETIENSWPPPITKKVPPPPGFSELDRKANTSELGPIGTKRSEDNPLQLFIQQMRQHQLLQQLQQSQQNLLDFLPSSVASHYSSSESRTPGSISSLTVTPPYSRSMTGTISPTSTASDTSSVPSVNSLEAALSLWESPPTTTDQPEPLKDNWSDVNSLWESAPKPPTSEAVWGTGKVWPVPRSTWTPCPEETRVLDTPRDSSEGHGFDPFRSLSSIWSPQNSEK